MLLATACTQPVDIETEPYAFTSPLIHNLVYDGPPLPPPAPDATVYAAPAPSPPPAPPLTIEQLICSYGWDCATALRIARCESGLNPRAQNGWFHGLFQIWTVHAPGEDLFDPEVNVAVAWRLYQSSGWRPWQCR